MGKNATYHVLHVRELSEGAYVLRFQRHGLQFEPGQYVNVGLRGSIAMREYSVYSGADDDFLEILVREIAGGLVSRALRRCEPGDDLSVEGPYGSFVTDPAERHRERYLFVGSGTGISPFHSLVRSYPDIDYLLLHGVRTSQERFDREAFDPARSVFCVTRTPGGDYRGRVTDYLRAHPVDPSRRCYLCGNSDMIYQAFAVLRDQGVPRDRLHAEIYF